MVLQSSYHFERLLLMGAGKWNDLFEDAGGQALYTQCVKVRLAQVQEHQWLDQNTTKYIRKILYKLQIKQ